MKNNILAKKLACFNVFKTNSARNSSNSQEIQFTGSVSCLVLQIVVAFLARPYYLNEEASN